MEVPAQLTIDARLAVPQPNCPQTPIDTPPWGERYSSFAAHPAHQPETQLVEHLIADCIAYANPTRLGKRLQACGYVHAVAMDVFPVDDNVADVNTDAEFDSLIRRHFGVANDHAALHVDCATHRFDDTGKLEQQSVASRLDYAPAVLRNGRVDELSTMSF